MIKRLLISISALIVLVLFSVFYNYQQTKRNTKTPTAPTVNISIVNAPQLVVINTPTKFQWQVEAPADLITTDTTLYYDYHSSPSALTVADSPEAVRYSQFAPDYLRGQFPLPDMFTANLSFGKTGTVYLRAYSKVGDRHFWTSEIPITVVNKRP
jgi:hypothetical protein